jgi:hypothetical protein
VVTVQIFDDTLFQVIIYLCVPGILFLLAMIRNSVIIDVLAIIASCIFAALLTDYGSEYVIVLVIAIIAGAIKLLHDSLSREGSL